MEIQNVNAIGAMGNVNRADMPKEYAPKVDLSTPQDSVEITSKCPKKKASAAKKFGVGVASFLIPGLGQFINGDTSKGVGHLLGNMALRIGAGALIAFPPAAIACGIGACVLNIASVVDAVKNV